jgi:hypothetical protein
MQPILLYFILFTSAVILLGFLPFFYKNSRKKKENLFVRLSREGSANNLTFCCQEILQNKVLGFDGINRKVMILEKVEHHYNCDVISLDEVQNCSVKICNGTSNHGHHDYSKMEKKTQSIELQFEFKNSATVTSIIFYQNSFNSRKELALLKAKAEYWKAMFSKILFKKVAFTEGFSEFNPSFVADI